MGLARFLILLTYISVSYVISVNGDDDRAEFIITMPEVKPSTPDEYITYGKRFWNNDTYYIVSFCPLATMDKVHHMILSGCEDSQEGLNPGECTDSTLLYAWARNAPRLDLPEGVGFKIGENSTIKYFQLQVHYANISSFQGGNTDHSGLKLVMTSTPLSKEAGTFLLSTGGMLPPHSTEHFEVSCPFQTDVEIHTFAFRTHTHTHGEVVAGYKVELSGNGQDNWTLIGKKNPQLPQFFYPSNDVVVRKGDLLAARCTMINNADEAVYIGGLSTNEMCNFYFMFYKYSNQSDVKLDPYCHSSGPPGYYWNQDKLLNNIPQDASELL